MSDIKGPRNPERLIALITRYCTEAAKGLHTAPDYVSALRLKETLCGQFEKECDSSLVVSATKQYLDAVLKERWGEGHDPPRSPGDSR